MKFREPQRRLRTDGGSSSLGMAFSLPEKARSDALYSRRIRVRGLLTTPSYRFEYWREGSSY